MTRRIWKGALILVVVGSLGVGLVFAEAPRVGGAAVSPIVGTPSTTEVCRQTCESEVAQIAFQVHPGSQSTAAAAANTCPARAQVVVPCAPYGCDREADTCRTRCDSDGQCAHGFICVESLHKCEPLTRTCSNNHTVSGNDGSTTECSPGRCAAGACVPLTYSCQSDRYVKGTDGSSHDCFPYYCVGGACQDRCTSVDQCLSPYVCDTNHTCIPRP